MRGGSQRTGMGGHGQREPRPALSSGCSPWLGPHRGTHRLPRKMPCPQLQVFKPVGTRPEGDCLLLPAYIPPSPTRPPAIQLGQEGHLSLLIIKETRIPNVHIRPSPLGPTNLPGHCPSTSYKSQACAHGSTSLLYGFGKSLSLLALVISSIKRGW